MATASETLCDPDDDNDNVPDTADADGGAGTSPAGRLAGDGRATTGTLLTGSLSSVTDVAAPKGIRLTAGASGATLTMCSPGFGVDIDPNTSVTITCGSITVENVTSRFGHGHGRHSHGRVSPE